MTKPRRKFSESPRLLTDEELAHYMGHSIGWLTAERRMELERKGFPRKDGLTGRTDRRAVDAFLDRRSGISGDVDDGFEQRLEAFGNGEGAGASSGPEA